MYQRNITDGLREALSDSPVVLLNGARQTGKSTLARSGELGEFSGGYVTLDDAGALSAAVTDPAGFLSGLEGPVVIDEVQRVPELFSAIKASVDQDRRPGRFLLTGSANVMLLPRLSESLAGRMELHALWPLSAGELAGVREGFIDSAFAGQPPSPLSDNPPSSADVLGRVLRGGFPEAVGRERESRRAAWFDSYVTTILQRDVRDQANIERLGELPRLLYLLAARTSSLLNYSELSRSSGLPQSTLKRYLALLETTFLVRTLPAWSSNLSKRLVRSPKIMLCDTGLAGHLQGVDAERLSQEPALSGPLLESFVAMELIKQASWSERNPTAYHYRTQSGEEIDVLLEDRAGRLVGIDVKASSTVRGRDFRGLKSLSQAVGEKLRFGAVLHTGTERVPFAENLYALPVHTLWQGKIS